MDRSPDHMRTNDALDLFEENGAEIKFFKGRCNLDEQVGRIMRTKKLFFPKTDEAKLLVAQLEKATEIIYSYLREQAKRKSLEELLEERRKYKPKSDSKKQFGPHTEDGMHAPKDNSQVDSSKKPKAQNGTRIPVDQSSDTKKTVEKKNPSERNDVQENNTAHTGTRTNNITRVSYTRGLKEKGEGNTVEIVKISGDSKGIDVPLRPGEKVKLFPPYISPEFIKSCESKYGVKLNINKYLIIEATPDKKIVSINLVYGDLDLDRMSKDNNYLKSCMNSVLSRKRINEVCRNYFGVLDQMSFDKAGNMSLVRNKLVDQIIAKSVLESSEEIRTVKSKGMLGSMFEKQDKNYIENILRLQKTGIMIVQGKQCSIYSYGTKDETTGDVIEFGSFMVSGLDEERFESDVVYRNSVIRNVITPSRLKNTRRADISYPYIGSVTQDGSFMNDFEIANELNDLQIQL